MIVNINFHFSRCKTLLFVESGSVYIRQAHLAYQSLRAIHRDFIMVFAYDFDESVRLKKNSKVGPTRRGGRWIRGSAARALDRKAA
jgi:hypothetical protein